MFDERYLHYAKIAKLSQHYHQTSLDYNKYSESAIFINIRSNKEALAALTDEACLGGQGGREEGPVPPPPFIT